MVVSFEELSTAIAVSPYVSSVYTKTTSALAKPDDALQGDKPVHG